MFIEDYSHYLNNVYILVTGSLIIHFVFATSPNTIKTVLLTSYIGVLVNSSNVSVYYTSSVSTDPYRNTLNGNNNVLQPSNSM